jgi:hypothetical protein
MKCVMIGLLVYVLTCLLPVTARTVPCNQQTPIDSSEKPFG